MYYIMLRYQISINSKELKLQATTAIVEKTVRAFYSTIAVVCCSHGMRHTSSILHHRTVAPSYRAKVCCFYHINISIGEYGWILGSLNHRLKKIHPSVLLTPKKKEKIVIHLIFLKIKEVLYNFMSFKILTA